MTTMKHPPKGSRVLVCGGRTFENYELVDVTLTILHKDEYGPIGLIINGGARGADYLARRWALQQNVLVHTYSAQWNLYGRRAGIVRNKKMLDEGMPDLVVAFEGGKGTKNMVAQATKRGVKVLIVNPAKWE